MDVFKTAQRVHIHLGNFCKKICHLELIKIAQSGHAALNLTKLHRLHALLLTIVALLKLIKYGKL